MSFIEKFIFIEILVDVQTCDTLIKYLLTYLLLFVRYVCAPYDFRDDLHRHRDDFHHRINMVCIFYPFICDSTINLRAVIGCYEGHLESS